MRRFWLFSSTALSLGLTITGSVAHADTIDIPAQPLAAALDEFGVETGMQVLAPKHLIDGLYSKSVRGEMSAHAALAAMLEGTGLSFSAPEADAAILSFPETVTQNAVDDDAFDLGTLVVRGELQDRTLQNSQTSATVVRGEEIEARGDGSVFDAIERAPNVSQISGRNGFTIRGISQFGVSGSLLPLISTQVDGIALPNGLGTGGGLLPTWDVDQVEILRGPQSTQQGRNALAGAVVIRTRDPIYENEYRLRGGLETDDFYEGAFSINQVLVEDRAALRLSGDFIRDDGDVRNTFLGTDDADRTESDQLRAKLRLNPTDRLELILSYSYQDNEFGSTNVDDSLFPSARLFATDIENSFEATQEIYGLRVSYDLGSGIRLESETSFYTADTTGFFDFDNTAADGGFNSGVTDSESFEQDLRLLFDGAGYSGVVGLFYVNSEVDLNSFSRIRGPSVPVPLPPGVDALVQSDGTTKSENWAIFGEIEFEMARVVPGLSAIIGARYDREDVKISNFSSRTLDPGPTPPSPIFGVEQTDTDASFDAFLPKLGLIYEFRPGLTTSFTYQEGYRAGGSDINPLTTEVSEFDPEFTKNYEIAFRGEFLDGRLFANANLFYTDWTDQQVTIFGPGGPNDFTIENAGESSLWGAEVAIDYAATGALDLFATVGYTRTEFDDFVSGGQDFTGNELPNAPDWTGSVGGVYRLNNGWSLGVDASYTSAAFSDAANSSNLKTDDRFLVNAQLNYERDGLLAGLYVRNLFDVDYAENRFRSRGQNQVLASAGEPLTVGAFLQYEF